MYQSCNASGKIIVALAEKGDMAALSAYTGQTGQKLDYMYLLQVRGSAGSRVRAARTQHAACSRQSAGCGCDACCAVRTLQTCTTWR